MALRTDEVYRQGIMRLTALVADALAHGLPTAEVGRVLDEEYQALERARDLFERETAAMGEFLDQLGHAIAPTGSGASSQSPSRPVSETCGFPQHLPHPPGRPESPLSA